MQSLKNYFKLLKVQNAIQDVLSVKEIHFVQNKYFRNVLIAVQNLQKNREPDLKKVFLEFITKNLSNQKQTLRILMIIHQILRQTLKFEVSDILIEMLFQVCKQLMSLSENQLEGVNPYLKKSFSVPYTTYLIRAYKKQSKEQFDKQRSARNKSNSGTRLKNNKQKFSPLGNIGMDFTVFNMVTDILKLNGELHQMGRYYSDHQYIINLYLQMLKDFEVYFNKIKNSFNQLIQLKKYQINDDDTERIYLYLSQSERCVNQMNSFYYNKYLYYYVNDKINLKMELEIPQSFYKVLNKSHGHQRKLSFDYCLTATHPGQKGHLQDTKESNRSRTNDLTKIIQSIQSLSQILDQIQPKNRQNLQQKKQSQYSDLRRTAKF